MAPIPRWSRFRQPWLIATALLLCISISFLLFRTSPIQHINHWISGTKPRKYPKADNPDWIVPPPPEIPGIYKWDTVSSFDPVHDFNAADKSLQDLCAFFPTHLLEDIQPVLKTGHGVLESRVRLQLQSISACLSNLIIVSDTEEQFEGHQIIDVIKDIPEQFREGNEQLAAWHNGSIADGTATRQQGWKLDKFKFLPAISRAWQMNSERKWYVFYEADTYIVWDTVFRWLEHFDPDEPHYFGYPSPGRRGTWFANGGPGYILSREAMRRLVKDDYDVETNEYLGSKLTERCWNDVWENCCGDSVLGWALILVNITLSGLSPMMAPHAPNTVPFSGDKKHWCHPVMTMHRPTEEDTIALWRWQFENRERDRPLLYRDMATSYFNFANLTTIRHDWTAATFSSFLAPAEPTLNGSSAHNNLNTCAAACAAHDECFSWTYHLRQCFFNRNIRLGFAREPSSDSVKKGGKPPVPEDVWMATDLRFTTGWDTRKIASWIDEHPCETVEWVHPSLKRVY